MSLQELISTYGYAAVGIGAVLEGETIVILAGFAAHRGYLELPWVILCSFLGSFCGDQLFFYLGRTRGKGLLDKIPRWKTKSEKVFQLLHARPVLFIIGFRFLYGLRTVTPFIIGSSGISPVRFLLLNITGALLWAVIVSIAGYLFGSTVELLVDNVKKYELFVFAAIAVIGSIVWLLHFRK